MLVRAAAAHASEKSLGSSGLRSLLVDLGTFAVLIAVIATYLNIATGVVYGAIRDWQGGAARRRHCGSGARLLIPDFPGDAALHVTARRGQRRPRISTVTPSTMMPTASHSCRVTISSPSETPRNIAMTGLTKLLLVASAGLVFASSVM